MRSISVLVVWLSVSAAGLLAVTFAIRRLSERVPWLVGPGFFGSCLLAVVLSTASARATGRSGLLAAAATMGMSVVVLAVWLPKLRNLGKSRPPVGNVISHRESTLHKAAYRLAALGALSAFIAFGYLAVQLWQDGRVQRPWIPTALMLLGMVVIGGAEVAHLIRRGRFRVPVLLLILVVAALAVPGWWGHPAAVLFFAAAAFNLLAWKRDRSAPGVRASES